MPSSLPLSTPPRALTTRRVLLVVGITLVAANLRPALAVVGPLAGDIRAATGLSSAAIGLLTTLPLLAFGIVSPFAPAVARRLGVERALGLALVLLGVGSAVRAVPSSSLLFGGTVLLGVGIALGNVLLPSLVKRDFSESTGGMTSLYSSAMGAGASLAAGAAVPLGLALGWRGALGVWALLAAATLVAWLPHLGARRAAPAAETAVHPLLDQTAAASVSMRSLARSPLAWQIALFMGLQSLAFYVILAWLPDLLQSRGLSASEAGWMLALSQVTGVAGSAVIPLVAARLPNQRQIVWGMLAVEVVSLAGLALTSSPPVLAASVGLIGAVLGGSFGLSLLLLVLRAPDADASTALSGMAQSVGYFVAATGPALFGYLYDATGGWDVPLAALAVVFVGKAAMGLGAARPLLVGAAPVAPPSPS